MKNKNLASIICDDICGKDKEEACKACTVKEAIKSLEERAAAANGNCAFFVKDKSSGRIHQVGTDRHDGIWVDSEGSLHYHNLQNGDGCSGASHNDDLCGYEFMPSDCGTMDGCQTCGHEACEHIGELREPCEKYIGRL